MEQLGTRDAEGNFTGSASNTGPTSARPYQWPSQFLTAVRKFVSSNGMEILSELEDKYDCASVCEVPLFYITRDISEGRPTQECSAGIYHSMKGAYKAEAAFSIILSLILWVSMCAAIAIGCGEDPDASSEQPENDRSEKYKAEETKQPGTQPEAQVEMQAQNVAVNDE